MRQTIATLLTAGLAVAAVGGAPAASVAGWAASTPTCLITNGGGGGGFTKTVVCAELRAQNGPAGSGRVGYGRFAPGRAGVPTSITVTVQFRPFGRPIADWVPLAQATRHGVGPVEASTSPVWLPTAGALRACTSAQAKGAPVTSQVCSAG